MVVRYTSGLRSPDSHNFIRSLKANSRMGAVCANSYVGTIVPM